MKVALVIEWIDPWRGGAETSTSQFVRHLLDRGVELTIVTRSRLSPAPGMAVHTVAVKSPFRSHQAAIFSRRATEYLRRGCFDVVHAISPCAGATIYEPRGGTIAETIQRNLAIRPMGLARRLKGAANRFNLKQQRMLRFERRWLGGRHRPHVIAISDYVTRQLRGHYDYPPALIHKVFNGVDPDLADARTRASHRQEIRRLYHIREEDLLAIMVAHNFRLKGLGRWIDALRQLSEAGRLPIRSLVIGKDNSVRWERRVLREGLGDRLQFTGPTRRVASFFHAADVLVHPTFYDPCSRVVLEALASGIPAVTTRYDGAAEVIQHRVNGWVLEDADCVSRLVESVTELADPAVRAHFCAAARASSQGLSMRQHAEGVYQIYQALKR